MELKETVDFMNSKDYKERFKAEYYQTKIRNAQYSIKQCSGGIDISSSILDMVKLNGIRCNTAEW